jgi:hypothetical protein
MSDTAEYWQDVKSFFNKKKKRYEKKINNTYIELINHPLCKQVGDQHRIDCWDFWWTGTVRNYKTGEQITLKQLLEKYKD